MDWKKIQNWIHWKQIVGYMGQLKMLLHRIPTQNKPLVPLQSKLCKNSWNRLLGYEKREICCNDDSCVLQSHPSVAQKTQEEKGIYGVDTRMDVSEKLLNSFESLKASSETQKRFAKNARASCILVHTNFITQREDGNYDLSTRLYGEANRTCNSEKFHNNPVVGFCSGITVHEKDGSYKVYSAGHCTKDIGPKNIAFIYDFRQQKDGFYPSVIPQKDVCFAEKIYLKEFISGAQDYTVFQMKDTPPFSIEYTNIDTSFVGGDRKVYVIGYPCGLPQISDTGKVLRSEVDTHFTTNLNTFHGNSGSGVFDSETDQLIGLLVRGDTDFVFDEKLKCNVSKVCDVEGTNCSGEDCMRISYIIEKEKSFEKEHVVGTAVVEGLPKENPLQKIQNKAKTFFNPKCSSCSFKK